MGLMDKLTGRTSKIESKSLEDFLDDGDITSVFSINSKTVTREQAERLAPVSMGVNLISESIAEMPVYLFKREENGSRIKVQDDRNRLLNMDNGSYSNAYNMKKNLITDYLYHGNGYLDIYTDNKKNIKTLIHIPYRDVSVIISEDINKRNTRYLYQYWGMTVQAHNVLNLVRNPKYDQMTGYGLLDEGRLTLASLMAIEEFMNNNAESGFNAKAVITKDTVMSKNSRESLRLHLKKFFSGSGASKSGGVLLLDDGMKLQQLNQSSQELELLGQKDLLTKDVARHLNLPLPIIGIAASGMTYSNEQQLKLTLLKQTLSPIIRNLEETFNRYLLTTREQQEGYFFEFQYNDLLKVSPQEELKVYGQAIKDNIMTINEVRQKINLKPKNGYDNIGSYPNASEQLPVESEINTNDLKGGDENEARDKK